MKKHKIISVIPDSPAERAGIRKNEYLIRLNNETVEDIFDYHYIAEDSHVEVDILDEDGTERHVMIEKDEDEDLGMCFEESLMDNYKSCYNKCIFCFIDQNPDGMRETIYFKDDDSRLSFLQGNYITFTNMKEEEIDRIIKYKLAPINISVHATDPEVRKMMLHNRFAGTIMERIKKLYDAEIPMNTQVVLCKGVNDGEVLYRTISDLAALAPVIQSLSIVPVGLTKYRENLYPMCKFTKEDAEEVIDMIEGFQKEIYEKHGIHFVHASDEWYILAERPMPDEESYDGYNQIENGVGMTRMLFDDFLHAVEDVEYFAKEKKISLGAKYSKLRSLFFKGEDREFYELTTKNPGRKVSTICGTLSYGNKEYLEAILKRIRPDVKLQTFAIVNDFFGHDITVTGLLTGGDIIKQLKGKDLGEALLIPSSCLKADEDIFLDDVRLEEVASALQVRTIIVKSSGVEYLKDIILR